MNVRIGKLYRGVKIGPAAMTTGDWAAFGGGSVIGGSTRRDVERSAVAASAEPQQADGFRRLDRTCCEHEILPVSIGCRFRTGRLSY